MKKIFGGKKGILIIIIGWLVLLGSFVTAILLTDVFLLKGNIPSIIFIIQMGIGALILWFGFTVDGNERYYPFYKIPKNPLQVFKPWQIIFICAGIMFIATIIATISKNEIIIPMFLFLMIDLGISAAVVKAKSGDEDKKTEKRRDNYSDYVKCSRCGGRVRRFSDTEIDGRLYCPSCYITINTEKKNEREMIMHTKCSGCGGDFPKSSLHIVGDRFLCEECFQKEFSVDL